MWISSPFYILFCCSICLQIFKSSQSAWIPLSSFSPQVQSFLEMKAEIFMHPRETGHGALSDTPNIARLPITPRDIPALYWFQLSDGDLRQARQWSLLCPWSCKLDSALQLWRPDPAPAALYKCALSCDTLEWDSHSWCLSPRCPSHLSLGHPPCASSLSHRSHPELPEARLWR